MNLMGWFLSIHLEQITKYIEWFLYGNQLVQLEEIPLRYYIYYNLKIFKGTKSEIKNKKDDQF